MRDSRHLLLLAALVFVGYSCGQGPSDPANVYEIGVEGMYLYFPDGAPTGITGGAEITIRACSGGSVPIFEVSVNGYELEFDSATGSYTGTAPGLAPGDYLVITVSDGSASISDSTRIPAAISNLQLDGGAWDCSSDETSNRWSWTNPDTTRWGVAHRIYDYDGESGTPIFDSVGWGPSSISATIQNSRLDYYEGIPSVLIVSGQWAAVSLGECYWDFTIVHVVTGVWGTWPASP